MHALIRCLGGSVEQIRRLRVRSGYNPESGHMVDASVPDDEFGYETLAGYVFDFAAAQLSAADDHLLALETLLLEGHRKIPPFVLGRAAIEAAGRAALFMDPAMSTRDKASLVLAERLHEFATLREMIASTNSAQTPEVEEDLALVDIQIATLQRYARQHVGSIPSRPGFRRVFRYVLDLGEGTAGFGVHARTLLSAIAHAVPDVMVGVSGSGANSAWRPGHVGFLDVDKVILINLVRAVLFGYFRAADRQIEAYGWEPESWRAWRREVSGPMDKAAEYVDITLAERRQSRRPSGPWETILGPDPISPGPVTEKTIERWGVEAMEDAGIDPSKIYAWRKTGLLVSDLNMHLLSKQDIAEWHGAVEEYRTEHLEEYEEWLSESAETDVEEADVEIAADEDLADPSGEKERG